jgi:hypothetical protein
MARATCSRSGSAAKNAPISFAIVARYSGFTV